MGNRSPWIVEIVCHRLADGGTIRVTRLGRTYNFNRWNGDATDWTSVMGLSKARAMELYADALEADVMELD